MGKLTDVAVRNAKPKAKYYRLADGDGLSLEVSPKGKKNWRFRFFYNAKEQMQSLGQYPTVSLSDARLKRDDARKLLDEGKHPTREKQAQKLRNLHNGENSFENVARRWAELRKGSLNDKY